MAVYWSYDAWITWKEHPVLTSVSSTGLPLQKIDFPAITICSQGLIQDVIFQALDKQFDDYLVGEGLDPDTMTQEEKDAKKDAYTQALYPGAEASPDSMVCLFH